MWKTRLVEDAGTSMDWRGVLLVEGPSDQAALEALASRRGHDLNAEGIGVVAMGGATNIGHYLARFGPSSETVAIAGLYDIAEAPYVRRGLERGGHGSGLTDADLEDLGFYACDADLEDELIRALGLDAVEDYIESEGELSSFRTLQKQPAQRGRTTAQQMHRFIGAKARRKIRYGAGLVNRLDLADVPRPLDRVLTHLTSTLAGT